MNRIVTIFLLAIGICLFSRTSLFATTILGNPTVCVGNTTVLSSATTGGTWSSDNAAIATVDSASGLVTGIAAGTATISYDSSGDVATTIVTVSLSVSGGSISGPTTVCVGSTIPLTDVTPGGTWSSSNTLVATIGSTGIVNGLTAGSATMFYSVTNGCGTASAIHSVT